jgi:iron(II)-dependent oxidoreductase
MSPLVWDVGHVGNFEELWLLRELAEREPHDLRLDDMYNPFDNPRWTRGDIPILNRDEALEYIGEVRGEALDILAGVEPDPESGLLNDWYVYRMVLQHEAQHQETILQALDLRSDLKAYPAPLRPSAPISNRVVDDAHRLLIRGGSFLHGTNDTTRVYDNERPQHSVDLEGFSIDQFPVTNRRYLEFVESGGYDDSTWWTGDGWTWRQSVDIDAPQGWTRKLGGGWLVLRFGHVLELDPAEPVQHVSFHEAEAFARFNGARLPTESEWEKAASWGPNFTKPRVFPWGNGPPTADHANLGQRQMGPKPVGSYPNGASAYGVEQMLGDGYEWTTSPFAGYPGFSSFPYPEYSEVFFGDEEYRVLKGASWATSNLVARNSFRNWDYRSRRQIFSSIRLVWDE